ncbi:nickel pincer cofactor biosynthesis protein LarC [Sporolactobacillus kofuensis]|uniref:Pyridinium-3,5-bisthiocarboxylic acid mononucleotide nickel insertion protein n=1 Tax=Sporolactobacillus kofuensis TaxID=269672 RepID=A0ABW1WET1_9BACL|nr:nickel pincer cofactor biosynthesis protein LarC [Sporolactobacillus kofuensis]MCO7175191.1 nickel pincer cofactor biosynthesis protein LarC [Sporolactobacillus kofuensis]
MKTLYLDAFSGISGDMFIGALLDLGIDFDAFKAELAKLHVNGYELQCEHLTKNSIFGTSFDVVLNHEKDHGFIEHHREMMNNDKLHHAADHHHGDVRHLKDILSLIHTSDVSAKVKKQAGAVFKEIAAAEAEVHHLPVTDVHFHEVGALDSIVDIVGCFIALELLGVDDVQASPLTDGSGFINVAHGQMPVPVPAVMQMRIGTSIPIKQRTDIHTELITPTGMGLVKTLVTHFGTMPEDQRVLKVGYGFGKRDTGSFNALRAVLFEKKKLSNQLVNCKSDTVLLIEANLDDQTGESLGFVMDVLLDAGALDVFFTPIHMKKNRPATKLSLLVNPAEREKFVRLLLKYTRTIGVRYQTLQRSIMQRQFRSVATTFGPVHVKVATYGDIVKQTPEYEDCAKIAHEQKVALEEVYQEVTRQLTRPSD